MNTNLLFIFLYFLINTPLVGAMLPAKQEDTNAGYYIHARLIISRSNRYHNCYCVANTREDALAMLKNIVRRKRMPGFIIDREQKITVTNK